MCRKYSVQYRLCGHIVTDRTKCAKIQADLAAGKTKRHYCDTPWAQSTLWARCSKCAREHAAKEAEKDLRKLEKEAYRQARREEEEAKKAEMDEGADGENGAGGNGGWGFGRIRGLGRSNTSRRHQTSSGPAVDADGRSVDAQAPPIARSATTAGSSHRLAPAPPSGRRNSESEATEQSSGKLKKKKSSKGKGLRKWFAGSK
jgi:hypothetical protein